MGSDKGIVREEHDDFIEAWLTAIPKGDLVQRERAPEKALAVQ
jgi:hypothetical protein